MRGRRQEAPNWRRPRERNRVRKRAKSSGTFEGKLLLFVPNLESVQKVYDMKTEAKRTKSEPGVTLSRARLADVNPGKQIKVSPAGHGSSSKKGEATPVLLVPALPLLGGFVVKPRRLPR